MRLHLLVLDGVFDLGLVARTDTLGTANELAATLPEAPAPIELMLVGVRKRVRTAQGLTVPVLPAACCLRSPARHGARARARRQDARHPRRASGAS